MYAEDLNVLSKNLSWLVGLWTGDNFSSKFGTVIRNGKLTSGRFGVNCNDAELVERVIDVIRKELKQENVRIDVQLPRNKIFSKNKILAETSNRFSVSKDKILVYRGSEWRRNIGYAAYVNNTELLRKFSAIYNSLHNIIDDKNIKSSDFLQGVADAEGDVNKVSRLVTLHTKDKFVLTLMKKSLKQLEIPHSVAIDRKSRYRVYIKDLKAFNKKVGFHCKRKQKSVEEILRGNLLREKDLEYFKMFKPSLIKGATVRQLQQQTELPFSTVGIVLRNLHSGDIIKRKKIGRKNRGFCYFYYLA